MPLPPFSCPIYVDGFTPSASAAAVARWEFGQIEPHDVFVRTIEAITDADIVRSPEAA